MTCPGGASEMTCTRCCCCLAAMAVLQKALMNGDIADEKELETIIAELKK